MKTVLIKETKGDVIELDVDIAPKKNEIYLLLGGPGTFVGQWPGTNVVIMKCSLEHLHVENENRLTPPFEREVIRGPILFIRMDENADHQDLTLEESSSWIESMQIQ
jgi:hypothetical protein